MNDLAVKVTVIAAILGAILLAGLVFSPSAPVVEAPIVPVVVEPTPTEITILPQATLEMLDPVYSEKAVFQDDTIRIAFNAAHGEDGVESRIPFWLHNVSCDVINVLWDRCSLQLPNGNTVKLVNEESLNTIGSAGSTISIAPAGDLFDAVIPVSEINWTEEDGWSVTSDVLTQGIFTIVLAIEKSCGGAMKATAAMPGMGRQIGQQAVTSAECVPDCPPTSEGCGTRQIAYYTFRFVIR